jgi:GH18 family chitinase
MHLETVHGILMNDENLCSGPSCAATTDVTNLKRIGYYNLGTRSYPCDAMYPDQIPAGALTNINIAFIQFTDEFELDDTAGGVEYGPVVANVAAIKDTYPDLRISVSVGGWDFNDGDTAEYFSNMASSVANRKTFIQSVLSYLVKYGLDGLDLGKLRPSVFP